MEVVSFAVSILSIAVGLFAIWQALVYKHASDQSSRQAQQALANVQKAVEELNGALQSIRSMVDMADQSLTDIRGVMKTVDKSVDLINDKFLGMIKQNQDFTQGLVQNEISRNAGKKTTVPGTSGRPIKAGRTPASEPEHVIEEVLITMKNAATLDRLYRHNDLRRRFESMGALWAVLRALESAGKVRIYGPEAPDTRVELVS